MIFLYLNIFGITNIIYEKERGVIMILTEIQAKRLIEFFGMNDFDYYDKYISPLSLEEQACFFAEFPDFMEVAIDNDS